MLTQIWIFAVAEQLVGANGPFWHVDRVQPQSSFSFRDTMTIGIILLSFHFSFWAILS